MKTLKVLLLVSFVLSAVPAVALEEVTIAQWGQEKYLIYLPLYVAMEEGMFAEQGISVRLKYSGNDDQTFAAVIHGSAQLGIGDPVFAAIARERGFSSRVVGLLLGTVANWGVSNQRDLSKITVPSDLAGLRIGSLPAPSTTFTLLKEFLEQHKAVVGSATIVEAPIGAQLALLEAGKADFAIELEPAVSIAESKGYRVVYSSAQFYGPYAFTGLTTTDDMLATRGSAIQKVVTGVQRALEALHRDPALGVRVAKKLFPNLPPSVVGRAVHRMLEEQTFPKQVVVSEEAWQRALETRLAVGDLKKPQKTDLVVDNRFADQAVKIVHSANN